MSLPPATGAVELASFQQHVHQFLVQNKRLDGRPLDALREPHILRDSKGGDGLLASTLYTDNTGTCLNCTVSGVFGPPPSDQPDEGRLTVDVAAPFFQSHSTDQVAAALREVARFVRSTIISCMDLTELNIINGEACWVLQVELVILNADGGLRAAALHAVVAAIHNMLLPRSRLPSGDEVESRRLRFHTIPVAVTIGVYKLGASGVRFLMDTNAAEESVVDGLLTVVLSDENGIITFVQSGSYSISSLLLTGAVNEFALRSAALRAAILKPSVAAAKINGSKNSVTDPHPLKEG
ncbi:exosome-associated protein 2, putative [Trypanosoma brucei gambiense DAL972]|uniref:Ribosomal RNA-processing protein 43 n=2 Tax=Trypanosoma brucei TaxID=5691 RepID=D0AAP8_TRYB9|nr:exosome-associated protein 2, putative [Trypanosoma brucei gambiense DAL972]RHW68470.1 exosome-associated protein 2 [Trypanosoma brucei equiperdum]CBH18749.1 exosome-associated protein 2, putative [Trypanosoma brucei gambiense DAL972]|eukprot:XP_011781013.1 exosome-associated protein 2, putative [Trypanosoma brucei gambiense DAL972]